MDCIALTIPKNLNFDVARCGEVFLNVDFIVAEVGFAFGTRRHKGFFHLAGILSHFHAATTAACCGLNDDGVANVGCDLARLFQLGDRTLAAGNDRDAKPLSRLLGCNLIAHCLDVGSGGANEGDVVSFQDLREFRVFRQKAIARMDRVRAGDFTGGDNLMHIEIGIA